MDSSEYRRTPLILPKLKAKAELLKALPSLRKYFPSAAPPSPERRGGSRRHGAPPPAEDSDDEEAAAARAAEELRRVKKERTALLQALAAARAAGPTVGDDVQSRDIANLRASLAEKQQALNELREHNNELERRVEALYLEHRDALLRAPEPGGGAAAVAAERLAAAVAEHEAAAKEMDTRAAQYQLLADRTARDRNAAEHAMQTARDLLAAAGDDAHALSQLFYEIHASKEAAERDLGASVAAFDDSRHEWQRRLRARRREVRAMERRLAEEAAEAEAEAFAAAEAAAAAEAEREAIAERARAAAAEVNAPEVLAALAAAEAACAGLQAISGGIEAPEGVVAAWRDLKERSEALQGLLEATREREDRVRTEVAELQAAAAEASHAGFQSASTCVECSSDAEKGGNEGLPEETRARERRQQLRRLGGLAAAAELSLSTLSSRLKESQYSAPEFWEGLRAQRAAQAAPEKRSSVVGTRRASVALPRRVSAVDLAASRGGQGPRRGSIAVPLDRRGSVAVDAAPAADSGAHTGPQADADSGFFPELAHLVAETVRQVESLLALEPLRAAGSPAPVPAAATAAPPGFKRSTMTGPAWVEIRVDNAQQSPQTPKKANAEQGSGSDGASPRPGAAAGLPPHAVEAADRYMRRLVGATVEPAPRRQDAFALEESDEEGDDRPVPDRAALKHRSHKITHPKAPKSPQRRGGDGGGVAAPSPVAGKLKS